MDKLQTQVSVTTKYTAFRPQEHHEVLIWISRVENLNVSTCLLL